MDTALSPTYTALRLVAVASQIDEIVGVSFLDVDGREYTRRYLEFDTLDLDLSLADRNGIFLLSCVGADWEGRGIRSAFYERRLNVLAERTVPRAVGIAWHRPAPVDSRVLASPQLSGTTRAQSRLNCPLCSGECTCTASLYGRPLSDASPRAL